MVLVIVICCSHSPRGVVIKDSVFTVELTRCFYSTLLLSHAYEKILNAFNKVIFHIRQQVFFVCLASGYDVLVHV